MIAEMSANLKGLGGITDKEEIQHNLSEPSMLFVKTMLIGIAGTEFFKEGKKEMFARNMVIIDETTRRKFVFNLEGEEV